MTAVLKQGHSISEAEHFHPPVIPLAWRWKKSLPLLLVLKNVTIVKYQYWLILLTLFYITSFLQNIDTLMKSKLQAETCSSCFMFSVSDRHCLVSACWFIFFYLTFMDTCIARCVFCITNEMQLIQSFSLLLPVLYMFRAVFPPIVRSL